MRLTASVTREGKWCVAQCPEVDVASRGKSVEDALANLKEALDLFFGGGPPAAAPSPPIIAPVEIDLARS